MPGHEEILYVIQYLKDGYLLYYQTPYEGFDETITMDTNKKRAFVFTELRSARRVMKSIKNTEIRVLSTREEFDEFGVRITNNGSTVREATQTMSPIYSYQCDRCGYQLDDLESINSPSVPRKCPVTKEEGCGGMMHRIPSIPSPARFNCSMPTPQKPREGP